MANTENWSESELFAKNLEIRGEDYLMNLLTEEVGELLLALNKYRRDPSPQTRENFAEEFADVKIVGKQVARFLAGDIKVDEWYQSKLHRLEARIKTKLLKEAE